MNQLKKTTFARTLFAVLGIGAAVAGAWGLRVGCLRWTASPRVTLCQTERQCPNVVFEWVEDPLTPEQQKAAAEAERQGGCIHYAHTGHYRIAGFNEINDSAEVLARAGVRRDQP